ncbi:hypothetical protein ABT247_12555 [Kitasatospora sp. NPDC001539]|uniref:hypothetical protein n=1 Tax=Kitasatospora sp. NPDC001539 TaxID=3154384 RepID=UPI00333486C3
MVGQQRGYWRESDGVPVAVSQAHIVWTRAAYPALVEVARRYHAVITYAELAEVLQRVSGVRTSVNQRHWINKVLALVVREAHRRGDPPLTALVVNAADGMVGAGYQDVLAVAGEPAIVDEADRELHAAAARLACYRHFGADLPADGGIPALVPRAATTTAARKGAAVLKGAAAGRGAASVSAAAARLPVVCPRCFLELPATRVCDSCGGSVP